MRAAAIVLVLAAVAAAQPAPTFTPPRIISAALPDLPAPNVAGGGEVLVEATVDRSGTVTRVILLRSTSPYTDFVLDAVASWRFQPARASNGRDADAPVEAPILIAAVYRPPTLFNGPTIGESPKDLAVPSGEAAFPSTVVTPAYPPNARFPAVLLFEVLLDESGLIKSTLPVASDAAFEGAALDALMQWKFKPGLVRGRPSPATAYVVFGFPPPVVAGVVEPPRPPTK
jgi:TonB family protein